MARDGAFLYVADTDNHALRRVNIERRVVTTVTGDGVQARWGKKGGKAGPVRLNSPWDVVFLEGRLYIAMAGSHQLWYFNPADGKIDVFAGSGREDITDGSLGNAALAQPSGITTDGEYLYFADSETSSIRKVSPGDGMVTTLVGSGLFDFGHRDGTLKTALLQHPLGVIWADGALWVADTYNNRIKRLDEASGRIVTVAGDTDDGLADGVGKAAQFDEPGGITFHEGHLYVADTNNHAVRIVDTLTGEVRTLRVRSVVTLSDNDPSFEVRMYPPAGFHINEEAPSEITAVIEETGTNVPKRYTVLDSEMLTAFFTFPADRTEATVELRGDLYVCKEGENATCYIRPFTFVRSFRKANGAPDNPYVKHTVLPPQL